VLDVLEREGLQENARTVGHHFRQPAPAGGKAALIGDVRGRGRWWAWNWCATARLSSRPGETKRVVNRMRDSAC
jgi:4-aminobutyrate aminotransferase-like enzyme